MGYESVKVITVEQILRYSSCPLKEKLNREYKRELSLSPSDHIALSIREGIRQFFNSLANGHRAPTAASQASRKFDETWVENISRVSMGGGGVKYDGHLLMTKIASIYSPKFDEVVATDFPLQLSFGEKFILKDTIDVLLINRSRGTCGKTVYRAIQLVDDDSNSNERYLQFRTCVFKMAMQKYLGPNTKRNYKYELRCLRSPDKLVTPEPFFVQHMRRVVFNIITGIKNKVWFPTTSKEVCKQCQFKKICSLTLII